MRRPFPAAVLALAAALVLTAAGRAQQPPKAIINTGGVRVGFPAAGGSYGLKVGAWAPVYVDLAASRLGRLSPGDGWIVVETADSDDVPNTYRVPLPPLEPEEQATVITYVRVGNVGSEVRVRLIDTNGREMDAQKARNGTYSPAPPGAYLYLALGRNSYLLQRALHPAKAGPAPAEVAPDQPAAPGALPPAPQGTSVEQEDLNHPDAFAHVEQAGVGAAALPSRWFGYRTADTIILYTGVPAFTRELLDERTGRKEALAEWVRRGGHLVISAGHEHQLVKALLEKMQIIGVTIDGAVQRRSLEEPSRWAGIPGRLAGKPRPAKAGTAPVTPAVEILKLDVDPTKGVRALITEPATDDDPKRRPLILEAPCGLGRVILVAFDLDQGPFLDWNFASQAKFWQKMNGELRPNQAREHAQPAVQNNWNGMSNDNSRFDVGTMMQDRLESFDEVPVISFGWVALFILIYIVIVGPLDYLFLKKVVKRLELTWITFPAVVLTVSAVAYVSAYYLKGNDLRINKVDVVDVVAEQAGSGTARGSHAYGSTWFTLFSPRIQNYTVGVEPAGPTWVPDALADRSATNPNPYGVLVGWMGRPENAWGGTGRTGSSPGLFGRRAYQYAPEAAALEGVPIQVWSTKSFTASWQAALPEDRPLFEADLKRTGQQGERIGGTITSRLPVSLDSVVLFYHNQRYELGRLEPGAPRKLDDLSVGGFGGGPERGVDIWFTDVKGPAYVNDPWNARYQPPQKYESAFGIVKELMFSAADTNTGRPCNSSLRYLDETWRLQAGNELIVVGRVPRQVAAAEQVSQDAATPTRLWLGQVPAPGEPRRPLAGKLSQETYVRVFIPLPPK